VGDQLQEGCAVTEGIDETDGLTFNNYIANFPYLGAPYSGYDVPS
jgi:hypothetical protein